MAEAFAVCNELFAARRSVDFANSITMLLLAVHHVKYASLQDAAVTLFSGWDLVTMLRPCRAEMWAVL